MSSWGDMFHHHYSIEKLPQIWACCKVCFHQKVAYRSGAMTVKSSALSKTPPPQQLAWTYKSLSKPFPQSCTTRAVYFQFRLERLFALTFNPDLNNAIQHQTLYPILFHNHSLTKFDHRTRSQRFHHLDPLKSCVQISERRTGSIPRLGSGNISIEKLRVQFLNTDLDPCAFIIR